MKKYLNFLDALEKINSRYDLDSTEVLLLDFISKASVENRLINVKDLLVLKNIASQATIHARLKRLLKNKLIQFKTNDVDGRLKEITLTKLGLKRFQDLAKAIA